MSSLTLGDKAVSTFSILTGPLLNIATHWADYNPATSVVLIWPGIARRGFNRPQMRKHPGKKLHSLHNVSISLPVKSSPVYLVPINIQKTSFHCQPRILEEVIKLRTTMWCLCLTFLHSKLVQIKIQLSFRYCETYFKLLYEIKETFLIYEENLLKWQRQDSLYLHKSIFIISVVKRF